MKKFLRGPIPWIVLALMIVGLALSLFVTPQYRPVQTDRGLELIQSGAVEQARIVDGEQRVDLILTEADPELGRQVQFYYVQPRGQEVIDAITEANPSKGFTDEVPQGSWLLSLLGLLLRRGDLSGGGGPGGAGGTSRRAGRIGSPDPVFP